MENESDEVKTKDVKETILLSWTAPEFTEYKRTWKWYAGASGFLLVAIAYAVFVRDWFIIPIAFVLFGVTLYYQKEKPKNVSYKISQLGFYIDDTLYPYNQLHSFWLILGDDLRILNLIFNKKYIPQRTILFYGVDPVTLREVLTKYIPEQEDREENMIEKLSRVLKI